MLKDKINMLKCPDCGADLAIEGKSFVCNGSRKHCFDVSSDGYVNFIHTSGNGDSKEAVAARRAFLDSGHYSPLCDEIKCILDQYNISSGLIADMGCGDGYYSVGLAANEGRCVFGCDLSKFAVKAAAKRSKALGLREKALYSVASVYEAPLKDGACSAVINLFAPCAEKEYSRILEENGILIVVGAGKDHLLELKQLLYESARLNDERRDLPLNMKLCEERKLKYKFLPENTERDSLFKMTPYYYKTSISDKKKLEDAPAIEITAEFNIYIYQKAKENFYQ